MPTSIPPNYLNMESYPTAMNQKLPSVSRVDSNGNAMSKVPITPVTAPQNNNANNSILLNTNTLSNNMFDVNAPPLHNFGNLAPAETIKNPTIGVGINNSQSTCVQNLEVVDKQKPIDKKRETAINVDSSDDEIKVITNKNIMPMVASNANQRIGWAIVNEKSSSKQDIPDSNVGNKYNANTSVANTTRNEVTLKNPQTTTPPFQMGVTAPMNINATVPTSLPLTLDITSDSVANMYSTMIGANSQPPMKKTKLDNNSQQHKLPPFSMGTNAMNVAKPETPLMVSTSNKLPDSKPTESISPNLVSIPIGNTSNATMASSPFVKEKMGVVAPNCDPVFASYVKLDPVPDVPPLARLNTREVAELERSLQFRERFNNTQDDGWRDDWSGNLQLVDKDIVLNRDQLVKIPEMKPVLMPFRDVVAERAKNGSPESFRGIKLLFSYIYHMKGTPDMAKKIMAYSLFRFAKTSNERLEFIYEAIRRISYDPTVLQQDGWTTVKSDRPDGASGGAFLIGRRVIWSRYEAIVIAFVRDDEIGDLWKAMWLEDLDTFDLEADELQEAIRKWETRESRKKAKQVTNKVAKYQPDGSFSGANLPKPAKPSTSTRFAATKDFTVDGIEHGIVLATPIHQNARNGIMWPARVMHVSEIKEMGSAAPTSRRSSQKNQIPIIFLAPYWNGSASRARQDLINSSVTTKSAFSTGPLFEMESVEVSDTNIAKYPYDADDQKLSIDKLRSGFRFLGLPRTAFSRYLDAHRLALGLKMFSKRQLSKSASSIASGSTHAYSALTDTHTMSVTTAKFPPSLLNLPYDFLLSKLPAPAEQASQLEGQDGEEVTEPVLKLHLVLRSMTPPYCWGLNVNDDDDIVKNKKTDTPQKSTAVACSTPQSTRNFTPVKSPDPRSSISTSNSNGSGPTSNWEIKHFASEYLLEIILAGSKEKTEHDHMTAFACLGNHLAGMVHRLNHYLSSLAGKGIIERKNMLNCFSNHFLMIKAHGEDALHSKDMPKELNSKNLVIQWRKACEKIFKCASAESALPGFGNEVTAVITDSRCNQHLTANGSYERAVRLPAAIKGAKMAGAGSKANILLVTKVKEEYMDLTEKVVLPKAHKASYLKRMKAKIAALPSTARGAPLTDDSDGEGGEDTMGSRGSFKAAITGVAAALQAVDMVVGGECVNAFCATRPPGHHAGWDLRAMGAISNGFCILNTAACAAIYAVSPQSEGGRGLSRVCIIDFDVHHGNGTQEVLCSTHDSRFLYVSTHAGGAHINGFEDEGDLNSTAEDGVRRSLGGRSSEGIFPGRCGDTSPHPGVLNIPLGQKVTASAIGNALVTLVTPAVEKFSPELVIISAGFDAHRNDPLGMGGLTSDDFCSVTEVICQMAARTCSGRVISILEGGYGVPCCLTKPKFLPKGVSSSIEGNWGFSGSYKKLDLGDDLPEGMTDEVPIALQQKLEKCHQEGFMHCVKEHVEGLARSNKRCGYGKK